MKKESGSKLISFLIGGIIFLVFIFPLYWVIVIAPKTRMEIFLIPTPLWPENLTFEAFIKQLPASGDTLRGFENSLIISRGTTTIATVLVIPAACGLAHSQPGARRGLVLLFLITQMLSSTLVPTSLYIVFPKMRLLDTYWTPTLTDAALRIPFNIIILRAYFILIPKELDEAAEIGGCGHVSTFMKIMLPIVKPSIVVTAMFPFVYIRGNLIYDIASITSPNMGPVISNIYNYVQQYQTLWNSTMTFGVIIISPVALIFIFMQRYIISSPTNGTVKA